MNIEKLKPHAVPENDPLSDMLRSLKSGECIRLKTAQEYRAVNGLLARIGNQTGVRFRTRNDGNGDVIVFIKEKP